jgi:predicted ferric reductase
MEYVKLFSDLKKKIMSNLLYLVAVILVIGWAIGVFAYSAGGLIHVLLVIAIIAILIRIISGRNPL